MLSIFARMASKSLVWYAVWQNYGIKVNLHVTKTIEIVALFI